MCTTRFGIDNIGAQAYLTLPEPFFDLSFILAQKDNNHKREKANERNCVTIKKGDPHISPLLSYTHLRPNKPVSAPKLPVRTVLYQETNFRRYKVWHDNNTA